MSLNYEEIFKQMAQAPQVREGAAEKAEQLRDQLETRWKNVDDVPAKQRAFLRDEAGRVVKVTEATDHTNRPTHVVTVRHPGAVAKQAKDGFVTKSVKAIE